MSEGVFLLGAGMTRFGRHPLGSLQDLVSQAASLAIADSGLLESEIDAVFFANAADGLLTGQEMVRGEVYLQGTDLLGLPIFNIENACASSSTALHLAQEFVRTGTYERVLVIGAEQLTSESKEKSLAAIGAAADVRSNVGGECSSRDAAAESQGGLPDESSRRSVFMDFYADLAASFINKWGLTQEDIALVSVKNRLHASLNPLAHYRTPISIEDVLSARPVVGPLTTLMCAPVSDGAAALVIGSRSVAELCGDGPLVRVAASSVSTTGRKNDVRPLATRATESVYELAGFGPESLDICELHDAAAPAELILYEELGLCRPGDGVHLLREGFFSLGGTLPVNTSGGLLSRGHPIGATGCAQVVEIFNQLRGVSGERQVSNANRGLCHNAGGHLGPEPAVCVTTLLERL